MAVTAKFQADFSSFLDAIGKAEKELVDFGEGASTVEKRLNNMVDRFSGRKLIQEVTLLATALEAAGGEALLSSKELEDLGAKAATAVDKAKKLGLEIPAGIQRIADSARGAAEETLRLGEAAKKAAKAEEDSAKAAADELKRVESAAKATADQFAKMVSSFSGQTLIKETTAMASALEKAGGTSVLTTKELEQMGAKADEAIAKMKKLGLDVPPEIQKISDHARGAAEETLRMGGAAKVAETQWSKFVQGFNIEQAISNPIGTAKTGLIALATTIGGLTLAATAAGAALVAMGVGLYKLAAAAAEVGGELDDMADKTGLSVPALSRLQNAAQVVGADMNQLTDVIFKLEKGVGDNTEEFQKGLAQMGLSTSQLKAVGPDRYLDLITAGLNSIKDPSDRAAAGAAVLGKGYSAVAASLVDLDEGLRLTADIKPWTTEQAAEAEKFDNAIQSLIVHVKSLGTAFGKDLIPPFNAFLDRLPDLALELRGGATSADITDVAIAALRNELDVANNTLDSLRGTVVELPPELAKFGQSAEDAAAKTKKLADAAKDAVTPEASVQAWRNSAKAVLGFGGAALIGASDSKELELAAIRLTAEAERSIPAHQKAAEEQKKFAEALKEVTSSAQPFYEILATINGKVVEGAKNYIAHGASLEKVALIYGLTKGQIDAIKTSMDLEKQASDALGASYAQLSARLKDVVDRERERINAGVAKNADATVAAERDAIDIRNKLYLNAYEYQKTLILREQSDRLRSLDKTTSNYSAALAAIQSDTDAKMGEAARSWSEHLADMDDKTKTWAKDLAEIPNLLVKSFTGGGGLSGAFKALTSQLGANLFSAGGPLNAVGNSLVKGAFGISEKFGNALAQAIPGIGSLIGPALQGITALFGKIFDDPEKKINPLREQFVQAAGGLDALNKKAHDAGLSLDRLLGARNEKQFQAAIDELTKSFAAQEAQLKKNNDELATLLKSGEEIGFRMPANLEAAFKPLVDAGKITDDVAGLLSKLSSSSEVDFKKMQAVAQKYGIDLAALGPAFESAKLSDIAKAITNDFDLLKRGGADVDAVLQGMKKPINDLVNESLKAGLAIPSNFKPWVEQLAMTGQLVDENGDKIVDLSGIKFSDPIVTEFQKIVDKLQELIDKISGTNGLNKAIADVPRDVTVGVHFNVDPAPDFGDGFEPIRMARGGEGRVTKPTLFLAGEGGPEDVSFRPAGQGSGTTTNETPDWARELIDTLRGLPRTFRDASFGAAV